MATQKYKGFAITALAAVGVAGILWSSFFYFEHVDAKREAAWATYEQCVEREYGTTPEAWYMEHGEVPDCNVGE